MANSRRLGWWALLVVTAGLCACTTPEICRRDDFLCLPEFHADLYTRMLADLGLMTEIYATPRVRIQCAPVGDNTGTALPSGGEIQRDITEIMKSTLNGIGGRVVFIPFDPYFVQSEMSTGYSKFEQKVLPDVVLSGGITEFDRGLETRSQNIDAAAGVEAGGLPDTLPSKDVELRYTGAKKSALSRITLDFNLLDFRTLTGIPKISAVNSMKVMKDLDDQEIGVSIFGQAFGLKGSVKRVQGRHAAVRMLVELSMIQILGKHLRLPYWRLLGEGSPPDPVVLNAIREYYRYLDDSQTIANIQEWLNLYGCSVPLSGNLDEATRKALKQICPAWDERHDQVDLDTFTYIYANIPLNQDAQNRRREMTERGLR